MLDEEWDLDGEVDDAKTNLGNFANDNFDDNLNNADFFTLKGYNNEKWIAWAIIVAKETLKDGCEVFVKYGKLYSILCRKIRKSSVDFTTEYPRRSSLTQFLRKCPPSWSKYPPPSTILLWSCKNEQRPSTLRNKSLCCFIL